MSDFVLIIDADKAHRSSLETAIVKSGRAMAKSTGDLDEGVSILDSKPIDVLVCDLQVHGGNGWRLALDTLEKHPDLFIFATSPTIDLTLGREMMRRGVKEIVYKPYEEDVLVQKIVSGLRAKKRESRKASKA